MSVRPAMVPEGFTFGLKLPAVVRGNKRHSIEETWSRVDCGGANVASNCGSW